MSAIVYQTMRLRSDSYEEFPYWTRCLTEIQGQMDGVGHGANGKVVDDST